MTHIQHQASEKYCPILFRSIRFKYMYLRITNNYGPFNFESLYKDNLEVLIKKSIYGKQ